MTIIPYFDPLLGKLRNSDVALISLASITDPFIVNNLQVLSNGSINNLNANTFKSSTISAGNITANNIAITSTISTNLINANAILASGATLGNTHISTIDWNLTSGITLTVEGQMNWDTTNQTVVVGMAGGNVDVSLGMETLFPKRVVNSTASTMPKGTVVYINGVSGNDPTVTRAIATSDMTSAYTIGMTAEDIASGQKGWVATFGEIAGLDLSAYTGGDTLYLSGVSAGMFTNVVPQAPIHYVRVGTVVKATANGALVVNVINGFETKELHDVVITSLASGQILQSGVSNLWYNVTPAFIPIASYPSLGSLAVLNDLSYTSLLNKPSLGSLAPLNDFSYTSLLNKPSLGSLAPLNDLSYNSLLNLPSLGSLAPLNDFSYTSLLNKPSLGSLAEQNTVDYVTQVTSKPSLGSLAVLNDLSYLSLISAPSLSGEYLRLDLTNQLSGATITFDISNTNKNIFVSRVSTTATAGKSLTITSGGAKSGGTNLAGGNLVLSSGIATGNGTSQVQIWTAGGGLSSAVDRTPQQRVTVTGTGRVGIGNTNPLYTLDVTGDGRFTSSLTASNLSGTNTGDSYDSVFGDGSDGYVSLDGSLYPDFATYNSSTTTYTLTRDVYAGFFIQQSGVILETAGYRIFCATTFTNNGTIRNNGNNASGITGGTGATAGFFKAGGTGAAGLGTGATGLGTAQAAITGLVGGIGGQGAGGRSGVTAQPGGQITVANAARPANTIGSSKIANGISAYLYPFVPSGTATNLQLSPSVGGGGGAKSATGTTATSGAGGGGGGVVFIAAPSFYNYGTIQANGGNGSNAAGTGGNFGGGGGGGGGVVAIVYQPAKSSIGTLEANGGSGGTSISGTNGTYPFGDADSTATGTTNTQILLLPSTTPSKDTLFLLSTHCVGGSVQSIEGYGMSWYQENYELFSTIANPGRILLLWRGYYESLTIPNVVDYPYIKINLNGTPTSTRCILDYVHNSQLADGVNPIVGNAVASSDSTTNITTDLGYTPTTGNLTYSVFARVGGTTPVVGTGNTVLQNQTTAPIMYTSVSLNRQTNNHTWTTATAAAAITVDIAQPTAAEPGQVGWAGKVVEIWA
jgi:hypothetical protein